MATPLPIPTRLFNPALFLLFSLLNHLFPLCFLVFIFFTFHRQTNSPSHLDKREITTRLLEKKKTSRTANLLLFIPQPAYSWNQLGQGTLSVSPFFITTPLSFSLHIHRHIQYIMRTPGSFVLVLASLALSLTAAQTPSPIVTPTPPTPTPSGTVPLSPIPINPTFTTEDLRNSTQSPSFPDSEYVK